MQVARCWWWAQRGDRKGERRGEGGGRVKFRKMRSGVRHTYDVSMKEGRRGTEAVMVGAKGENEAYAARICVQHATEMRPHGAFNRERKKSVNLFSRKKRGQLEP